MHKRWTKMERVDKRLDESDKQLLSHTLTAAHLKTRQLLQTSNE